MTLYQFQINEQLWQPNTHPLSSTLASQQLQVQRSRYARPRSLRPRAGASRPLRALRARACQYQLTTRVNGKLLIDLELVYDL